VAAEAAGAKPSLNRILKDGLLFVGVATASVNNPHASQVGANRSDNEFIQCKARFLLVHSMKVEPGLH
jgi:hypothetical protein